MKAIHKTPRLHIDTALDKNAPVELPTDQTHYLKSVLRLEDGQSVRLFNGRDGEWLCRVETLGKKTGTLIPEHRLKSQPAPSRTLHLLFAPIKKHRMDFLIEKAVELGVTDLHPVITDHTQTHKLNEQRLHAQIIEAAEQCERMSLPKLHPLAKLDNKLNDWHVAHPIYWAAERIENIRPLTEIESPQTFLIGPEGGFSQNEFTFLSNNKNIIPVSLGNNILRAETAALYCLSNAKP
ncbi:MAG: 16S rRNA (uracil(1498)-N(3))-methyltransferase [Rhodospirillales bacterium]|nr:16S rRNA (uracil(1498)-N(3))-methyltransferase [Rhodospirillales bacterium]